MPQNITDVNTFTAPIVAAAAGDARTAASVVQSVQGLANRTNYLKSRVDTLEGQTLNTRVTALEARIVNGLLLGPGIVSSVGGTQIVVGDILALAIGGVHFGEQSAVTVSPAVLGSSSWHYLYAYNNAGVIAYEPSLTAPGNNQVFENADSTRRYICSYYVNGSNLIKPFRKVGNRYTWRRTSMASADSMVTGAAFSDAGPSTRSLAAFMSPLSRIVSLEIRAFNGTATSTAVLKVRTGGDTTSDISVTATSRAINDAEQLFVEMETNSAREITTEVAGSGTPSGLIIVNGYAE